MVVDDLDAFRTILGPSETNSILIVDADAVLTGTITGQTLEAIPWRRSHVLNGARGVELLQLSASNTPQVHGASSSSAPTVSAIEDVFGCLVLERPDHP